MDFDNSLFIPFVMNMGTIAIQHVRFEPNFQAYMYSGRSILSQCGI